MNSDKTERANYRRQAESKISRIYYRTLWDTPACDNGQWTERPLYQTYSQEEWVENGTKDHYVNLLTSLNMLQGISEVSGTDSFL